jgi:putative phosphoribosyl transferase
MVFRDREQAGRLLAVALERHRGARPVVLGLTRGGVPVALEVALALDAELDVIVARKLAPPECPEYAVGAVAEGGAVYVRRQALAEAGLSEEDVAWLAEREAAELVRRVALYRRGRPMIDLAGRTAIVVDDGVATGATAHAAARAARQRGARAVVLAAPVIAAASVPALRAEFDDVVAVDTPDPFLAVGQFYGRFEQVADDDVAGCLREARALRLEGGDPGRRRPTGAEREQG